MTKNTKTGKGDIQNLVKETFLFIVKLSLFLGQFMIQLLCSGPSQFPNMDIDDVKLLTLGLT